MRTIAYDRPGAHGEQLPGCDGRTGMLEFRRQVVAHCGFTHTHLGTCSIRSTSGGTNWSVHAVSRATDYGYAYDERNGKYVRLPEVDAWLNWLTEPVSVRVGSLRVETTRAEIIGIQAIHDYAIGEDGSVGMNRPRKRRWGHGKAGWGFGSLGNGWFWLHYELNVAAATVTFAQMAARWGQALAAKPYSPPTPPVPPEELMPDQLPIALVRHPISNTQEALYVQYAGFKVWVEDPDAYKAQRAWWDKRGLPYPSEIIDLTADEMRDLGQVHGKRPPGTDVYGRP